MENQKWTEAYQVYWHDTDVNGNMSFAALSRYLQDIAWKNAESLDFGFKKVTELNLIWVLVRQLIQMNRMPRWGERIKIETWPRGCEGLWAYRDYQIKNEKNEILGGVSSSWMVIDTNTRRPQKLEVMEGVLPKTILNPITENSAAKIPFLEPGKLIDTRHAKYSELDMNGHVNNPIYIDWMMDAISKVNKLKSYSNFQINYISETKENDIRLNGQKGGLNLLSMAYLLALKQIKGYE